MDPSSYIDDPRDALPLYSDSFVCDTICYKVLSIVIFSYIYSTVHERISGVHSRLFTEVKVKINIIVDVDCTSSRASSRNARGIACSGCF